MPPPPHNKPILSLTKDCAFIFCPLCIYFTVHYFFSLLHLFYSTNLNFYLSSSLLSLSYFSPFSLQPFTFFLWMTSADIPGGGGGVCKIYTLWSNVNKQTKTEEQGFKRLVKFHFLFKFPLSFSFTLYPFLSSTFSHQPPKQHRTCTMNAYNKNLIYMT